MSLHKPVVLLALLLMAAYAMGQDNPLRRKIDLEVVNQPFEDALLAVADQARLSFSYNPDILPVDSIVNVSIKNTTVNDALKAFLGHEMELKTSGNHLVILNSRYNSGQGTIGKETVRIEGHVRDQKTGKSVGRATIYDVNQLNSAFSDSSGYFSLEVSVKEQYLGLAIIRADYEDTTMVLTSEDNKLEVLLQPIEGEGLSFDRGYGSVAPIDQMGLVKTFVNEGKSLASGERDIYVYRLAQVSFLPFMGTNLLMSGLAENRLSFNVIAGYNGSFSLMEIAGILNITRYDSRGLQLSGIGNIAGEAIHGTQMAGIFNLNRGNMKGVQLAGIVNSVFDTLSGVQLAGIANFIQGTTTGMQVAGIINYAHDNVDGTQLAGIVNFARHDVNKIQLAGLANYGRQVNGLQIAGLLNVAPLGSTGGQLAGLTNFSASSKKAQVAGLVNMAYDSTQGTQVSLVNISKLNNGLQLGLVNVADTSAGLSLGMFNFIRKGYNKVDVFYAASGQYGAKVKFGAKRFYNILGYIRRTDNRHAGFIYGIGRVWGNENAGHWNVDLIMTSRRWTSLPDVRTKSDTNLSVSRSFKILDWLQVYLQVSNNNTFFSTQYPEARDLFKEIAPIRLYERAYPGTLWQGGLDGEVGFRLF